MKFLHRKDLFCWSQFDTTRNIDFNGFLWTRSGASNVAIDPMPATDHDLAHMEELGGVGWILITNPDHLRGSQQLMKHFGAKLAAPEGDREHPALNSVSVGSWFAAGDTLPCGIGVLPMEGSKLPAKSPSCFQRATH